MKQEPGRQQPGIPSLQGGEEVKTANLRAACVLQRMWLRAWGMC